MDVPLHKYWGETCPPCPIWIDVPAYTHSGSSVHVTHLGSPCLTLSQLTSFHLNRVRCVGRSHGILGRAR